ncbi:LysM peptidoglycan-binding domain-containing protein [Paenibacillus sp. FSL H7-0350]|uniref:LysM peptidoglycan-binding domain-containing protein n=1 Tax=Paenibacillus sp. FSL H7-0350 TaxID=2975345 RepID=UPI00315882D5
MLYIVQPGDSLYSISNKYKVPLAAILEANVICNPAILLTGQPLIIPDIEYNLPKAGGRPYYIVSPGDTIWCLAQQFSINPETLMRINRIDNPHHLQLGRELLIMSDFPDAENLFESWNIDQSLCDTINSIWQYEVFYKGQFYWEALGESYVPYLIRLLNHPCDTVRMSVVSSLGRIAQGENTRAALQQALMDPDHSVKNLAKVALKRMDLVASGSKRIHVINNPWTVLSSAPFYEAPNVQLQEGTPIVVLRWNIPSPVEEIIGPGSLAVYDYVQILETGQTGYIVRPGFSLITFL